MPLTRTTKITFWFLLGLLSTAIGELIVGSSTFIFFDPFTVLFTLPLYLLHTLFFLSLAYWNGVPRFSTLYFLGVLFGLYEAYVTKVLFLPAWETQFPEVFGIYPVETFVLIFFWHPLLSFILPVLIAESLLTRSRNTLGSFSLPWQRKLGNHWAFYFAALLGLVHAGVSPNPLHSLLVWVGNVGIILLLLRWWRKKQPEHTLSELLPNKSQFNMVSVLFFGQCIVLALWLRGPWDTTGQGTVWPSGQGHAIILGLYALFIWLYVQSRKKVGRQVLSTKKVPFKAALGVAITFGIVSLVFSLVVNVVMILVMYVVAFVVGVQCLYKSFKEL